MSLIAPSPAGSAFLTRPGLRARVVAALVHLGLCAAVAAGVVVLVLVAWYPAPYDSPAGGLTLLKVIIGVDVVLGPALTFAVFDITKQRGVLKRDLAVIASLQALALAYGLNVCHDARPVMLVYEVDRFRLVAANQVREEEFESASPAFRELARHGVGLAATRPSQPDDVPGNVALAMAGTDLAQRPTYWMPYESALPQVLAHGRPIDGISAACPDVRAAVDALARDHAVAAEDTVVVPLQARSTDWSVLLSRSGSVLGIVRCDSFGIAPRDATRAGHGAAHDARHPA